MLASRIASGAVAIGAGIRPDPPPQRHDLPP